MPLLTEGNPGSPVSFNEAPGCSVDSLIPYRSPWMTQGFIWLLRDSKEHRRGGQHHVCLKCFSGFNLSIMRLRAVPCRSVAESLAGPISPGVVTYGSCAEFLAGTETMSGSSLSSC